MLKRLKINNYALIDSIEISFDKGMTSITGETGAGKSIILGGLSMVLGSRIDNSKIINKNKKCFVESEFDLGNQNLEEFFKTNDLDYDDITIIRREVNESGKSRAFINDTPVKLDLLSSLTNKLIDVHSQFNNLSILDSNFIFLILDSLSNNHDKYSTYLNQFKSLKVIERKIYDKKIIRDKLNSDLDYNKFLLNEFDELNFDNLNVEDLDNKVKEGDNIDQIKEILSHINNEFNTDEIGISDKLSQIIKSLSKVANTSSRLSHLTENLNLVNENINQIVNDSESILEDISNSDENINKLRDKLDKIYSLQNKHKVDSIDSLLKIREDLENKISSHDNIDLEIEQLEAKMKLLNTDLLFMANKIHDKRKSIIPEFEILMNKNLSELGMEKSDIKIDLSESEIIQKNGISEGKFLFRSVKGNHYSELKEIASGGEISRVMLSIKSILSNFTKLSSIIFDEIDTGISGSVSSKVAELMKYMSDKMQVIVITHTAQVASKGDFHYKVYKKEENNKIITDVKLLSDKERVNEIAEMLSGDKSNKSANELANELLN
ncbi:AAA family ATPase [Flavobacteriaceae bacterium]|nr:AAA family ATPase [Flavobacteriaceae bacterium]MDC6473322.1 AAA family ATPase [Flavobacteriaceae bacterium]